LDETKYLVALLYSVAVASNDRALAERMRDLRNYGWRERYISETPGVNSRLDDLQAAILRVKLRHLDKENRRRRQIARCYDELLGKFAGITLPKPARGLRHVYHQYVIRLAARDLLRVFLNEQQIGTAILYPVPIHQQPGYRDRIATAGPLLVTERAAQELLCLPVHPFLDAADLARISAAITDWSRA
jgi:dTDP-4-amino-4,6-dideoxygalactose transaminase